MKSLSVSLSLSLCLSFSVCLSVLLSCLNFPLSFLFLCSRQEQSGRKLAAIDEFMLKVRVSFKIHCVPLLSLLHLFSSFFSFE